MTRLCLLIFAIGIIMLAIAVSLVSYQSYRNMKKVQEIESALAAGNYNENEYLNLLKHRKIEFHHDKSTHTIRAIVRNVRDYIIVSESVMIVATFQGDKVTYTVDYVNTGP